MDTEHRIEASLGIILRSAEAGTLPQGWLYLADESTTLSTAAILLPDDAADEPDEMDELACSLGYPKPSLDTQTLEDIVKGLRRLTKTPRQSDYLRAFCYYADFDAFLPSVDAPDPPPAAEVLLRLDRNFYDGLGEERSDRICRRDGCERGAVQFSVLCRRHHFESVRNKPCPFD